MDYDRQGCDGGGSRMPLDWIVLSFVLTTIYDVVPVGPVIVIGGVALLVVLAIVGLVVAGLIWLIVHFARRRRP
jgi:hypothetical protein